MNKLKFNVKEEADYSILSFVIEGVLSPEDLAALTPPKVDEGRDSEWSWTSLALLLLDTFLPSYEVHSYL